MAGTIVVCAVLVVIVAAIVHSMFKKGHAGTCSCGCDKCSCSKTGSCKAPEVQVLSDLISPPSVCVM